MQQKYVFTLEEATAGLLKGDAGISWVLLDRQSCGARYFSLLVSNMKGGVKAEEHSHPESEHGFYVLSGTGKLHVEGQPHKIGPGSTGYVPAGVMHTVESDTGEDLTYVVVYAPAGPEQEIKKRARST